MTNNEGGAVVGRKAVLAPANDHAVPQARETRQPSWRSGGVSTDPARAIEVLRPAATYEFAQPGISFYGVGGVAFGAMYPTYVRGMSYLALRKAAEAAAEFQKILEHPGVVLEDPMGALARLQLARAWTMAGDVVKAKAIYEEQLWVWKEADPEIPVVSEARAEYARLP
jgi:eukaryotic-like serine/threonine-protein kinase